MFQLIFPDDEIREKYSNCSGLTLNYLITENDRPVMAVYSEFEDPARIVAQALFGYRTRIDDLAGQAANLEAESKEEVDNLVGQVKALEREVETIRKCFTSIFSEFVRTVNYSLVRPYWNQLREIKNQLKDMKTRFRPPIRNTEVTVALLNLGLKDQVELTKNDSGEIVFQHRGDESTP